MIRTSAAIRCLLFACLACQPSGAECQAGSVARQEPDVVLHAGGRIQLSLPAGWSVVETSHAREVRLLIVPRGTEYAASIAQEGGFWVCAHAALADANDPTQLDRIIPARLRWALGQDATLTSVADPLRLGPNLGVVQSFNAATRHGARQGFHALVACGWGICEIHANVPLGNQNSLAQLHRLVEQIRLNDLPVRPAGPLADHVEPARAILGSWKAYRSRLRLKASGRVEITLDRPHAVGSPDAPPAEQGHRIQGQFEARDDLLYVRWDDGSLLNFRWRLDGEELLMTDHDGRISQLRRVLD